MSIGSAEDFSENAFLARVGALLETDPRLSPIGASVLLAAHLGIARDSRTFARIFGLSHAFVLREVSELADGSGLVSVIDRDARTQRTTLSLSDAATRLIARAERTALTFASGDSRPSA